MLATVTDVNGLPIEIAKRLNAAGVTKSAVDGGPQFITTVSLLLPHDKRSLTGSQRQWNVVERINNAPCNLSLMGDSVEDPLTGEIIKFSVAATVRNPDFEPDDTEGDDIRLSKRERELLLEAADRRKQDQENARAVSPKVVFLDRAVLNRDGSPMFSAGSTVDSSLLDSMLNAGIVTMSPAPTRPRG